MNGEIIIVLFLLRAACNRLIIHKCRHQIFNLLQPNPAHPEESGID